MRALRGLIFTITMWGAGGVAGTLILLTFWAPYRVHWSCARFWPVASIWAARFFCGMTVSVEGEENIPDEPCVFLIKHTTAFETFWQIYGLPPTALVFKRELLWIPLFGWALSPLGLNAIAVNRKSGGSAIKQIIEQGKEKLASGLSISMFPEGTRMAAGTTRRYGVSGAALAREAGCKVVPVAHNAGDLWPKHGLAKIPGNILFSIGPPIDATGREARETNRLAQEWVENKMSEISRHYPKSKSPKR